MKKSRFSEQQIIKIRPNPCISELLDGEQLFARSLTLKELASAWECDPSSQHDSHSATLVSSNGVCFRSAREGSIQSQQCRAAG